MPRSNNNINTRIRNLLNSNKYQETWKLIYSGKHILGKSISTKPKVLGIVKYVLGLKNYHQKIIEITSKDEWIDLLNKVICVGSIIDFIIDTRGELERLKSYSDYEKKVEATQMVIQIIPSLDSELVNIVLEISYDDGITYEKFNIGGLQLLFDLNNKKLSNINNNNGNESNINVIIILQIQLLKNLWQL